MGLLSCNFDLSEKGTQKLYNLLNQPVRKEEKAATCSVYDFLKALKKELPHMTLTLSERSLRSLFTDEQCDKIHIVVRRELSAYTKTSWLPAVFCGDEKLKSNISWTLEEVQQAFKKAAGKNSHLCKFYEKNDPISIQSSKRYGVNRFGNIQVKVIVDVQSQSQIIPGKPNNLIPFYLPIDPLLENMTDASKELPPLRFLTCKTSREFTLDKCIEKKIPKYHLKGCTFPTALEWITKGYSLEPADLEPLMESFFQLAPEEVVKAIKDHFQSSKKASTSKILCFLANLHAIIESRSLPSQEGYQTAVRELFAFYLDYQDKETFGELFNWGRLALLLSSQKTYYLLPHEQPMTLFCKTLKYGQELRSRLDKVVMPYIPIAQGEELSQTAVELAESFYLFSKRESMEILAHLINKEDLLSSLLAFLFLDQVIFKKKETSPATTLSLLEEKLSIDPPEKLKLLLLMQKKSSYYPEVLAKKTRALWEANRDLFTSKHSKIGYQLGLILLEGREADSLAPFENKREVFSTLLKSLPPDDGNDDGNFESETNTSFIISILYSLFCEAKSLKEFKAAAEFMGILDSNQNTQSKRILDETLKILQERFVFCLFKNKGETFKASLVLLEALSSKKWSESFSFELSVRFAEQLFDFWMMRYGKNATDLKEVVQAYNLLKKGTALVRNCEKATVYRRLIVGCLDSKFPELWTRALADLQDPNTKSLISDETTFANLFMQVIEKYSSPIEGETKLAHDLLKEVIGTYIYKKSFYDNRIRAFQAALRSLILISNDTRKIQDKKKKELKILVDWLLKEDPALLDRICESTVNILPAFLFPVAQAIAVVKRMDLIDPLILLVQKFSKEWKGPLNDDSSPLADALFFVHEYGSEEQQKKMLSALTTFAPSSPMIPGFFLRILQSSLKLSEPAAQPSKTRKKSAKKESNSSPQPSITPQKIFDLMVYTEPFLRPNEPLDYIPEISNTAALDKPTYKRETRIHFIETYVAMSKDFPPAAETALSLATLIYLEYPEITVSNIQLRLAATTAWVRGLVPLPFSNKDPGVLFLRKHWNSLCQQLRFCLTDCLSLNVSDLYPLQLGLFCTIGLFATLGSQLKIEGTDGILALWTQLREKIASDPNKDKHPSQVIKINL